MAVKIASTSADVTDARSWKRVIDAFRAALWVCASSIAKPTSTPTTTMPASTMIAFVLSLRFRISRAHAHAEPPSQRGEGQATMGY